LPAGLAEGLVVEHEDREIAGALGRDGRERAETHEELAVPRDHEDAPLRPGKRQAEADHGRTSHRTPEIEIEGMVAGRGGIIARRAEAADEKRLAALRENIGHQSAPVEHGVPSLTPGRRSAWRRACAGSRAPPPAARR